MDSIPLFPEWCAVEPTEKQCTAFGLTFQCVSNPNNNDLFSTEIVMAQWVTGLALFVIGFVNLSETGFPFKFGREHTMKLIPGLYAIDTAIFSLCRLYFGISRITLAFAAFHNLGEWSMLMMVAAFSKSQDDVLKTIRYFVFHIYAVVVLAVMVPTLSSAIMIEELQGITIDFTLAVVFTYMYIKNRNNTAVRQFYYYPMMAHAIHLIFTTIPLVLSSSHIGYTSWYNSFFLESAIYISSPITHVLYMVIVLFIFLNSIAKFKINVHSIVLYLNGVVNGTSQAGDIVPDENLSTPALSSTVVLVHHGTEV